MELKYFFVFVLLIRYSAAEKLPSDISLCKAGDGQCIAQISTQIIRNYSEHGRSDMAIPPLDPFKIDKIVLLRQDQGLLDFKWVLSDLDIRGLRNLNFINMVGFQKDPSTSKFEVISRIPKLTMKGKYNASGRVLILVIEGDGDFEIEATDVQFDAKFKPSIHMKNGQKYLGIDQLKIFLLPDKVSIKLTNLFHGNKLLGENFNLFLNENWREVWQEYSPVIYEAYVNVFRSVSRGFFEKFSYDDFYLPD